MKFDAWQLEICLQHLESSRIEKRVYVPSLIAYAISKEKNSLDKTIQYHEFMQNNIMNL